MKKVRPVRQDQSILKEPRAKGQEQDAKGKGQEATRRRKEIEQMFGARKTSGPQARQYGRSQKPQVERSETLTAASGQRVTSCELRAAK